MKKIIMLLVMAVAFTAYSASAADQRSCFDLKGPVKSVMFNHNEITVDFTRSGSIKKSDDWYYEFNGNNILVGQNNCGTVTVENGGLSSIVSGGQGGFESYTIKAIKPVTQARYYMRWKTIAVVKN